MEIREMLDEEIKSEFDELKLLTPGSKEKSAAVEDVVKLYHLGLEEDKESADESKVGDEIYNREFQREQQKNEVAVQKNDRRWKMVLDAAGIIFPLGFYGLWMNRGFKFEETGAFTSFTFKNFLNRLRPTKK